MALTESRLPTGRISRTQLQSHVTSSPAIPRADMCTLSCNDMEVYTASLRINAKHINSCLQRTMIKHWRYGFLGNNTVNQQQHQQQHQQQNEGISIASAAKPARLQLLQQERQRLNFIKQYRAAYGPVCLATDNLDALLQMQKSKWDSQNAKQRHNTIADIEDGLRTYYDAVAHLVLNLLPGHLFLEVYSQEDSFRILRFQQAGSEYATSCLSTHLPLHTSK